MQQTYKYLTKHLISSILESELLSILFSLTFSLLKRDGSSKDYDEHNTSTIFMPYFPDNVGDLQMQI